MARRPAPTGATVGCTSAGSSRSGDRLTCGPAQEMLAARSSTQAVRDPAPPRRRRLACDLLGTHPMMRIILISAHSAERSALQQLLSEDGHRVTAVASRSEGVALATSVGADVVIADVQLATLDGGALQRELTERGTRPQVILLCSRRGCVSDPGLVCLTKPIDIGRLRRCLAPHRAAKGRVA